MTALLWGALPYIASPCFHYGILFVLAGHLVGLFVPMSWTDALGVSEHTYHLFSLYGGTAAGVLTVRRPSTPATSSALRRHGPSGAAESPVPV